MSIRLLRFTTILAALALAACGGALHDAATAPARTAPPPQREGPPACAAATLPGLEPYLEDDATLLIGELHGTRQIPDRVGDLVCQAARRGPVTLGLELPLADQPALDRFMIAPDDDDARAGLLASTAFARVVDGRGSLAMADLLDRARSLARAGHDVALRAFVKPSTGPQSNHEIAMAEQLAAIRADRRGGVLVILVGNLHAMTARGPDWDFDFIPMGEHLAAKLPALRSLRAAWAGGAAWTCEHAGSDGGLDCAPHPVSGRPRGERPFVAPTAERAGFDGLLYVGAVEASPPASPEARAPGS